MAIVSDEIIPEAIGLARSALSRGLDAIEAGDRLSGVRWVERAHRLAPDDLNIALSLATTLMGHDDARAALLFQHVVDDHDLRDAWFGLAAARFCLGDPAGAACALTATLRRHIHNPAYAAMATDIARKAGAAGWCGVGSDGNVAVEQTNKIGVRKIHLDGKLLPNAALPAAWRNAQKLSVTIDGVHLLGSPIDLRAICRTEGCVETWQGGLRGWVWQPNNPDVDPALDIVSADGRHLLRVAADDLNAHVPDSGPLARPRGFAISSTDAMLWNGPIHVRGPDGRDLLGSPLDPSQERRSTTAAALALAKLYPALPSPDAPASRHGGTSLVPPMMADVEGPSAPVGLSLRPCPVAVVIPVYGRMREVAACLDSVLATVPKGTRILVVDDASPEPELAAMLDAMAAQGRIELTRHERNLGFPTSVNAGMHACLGHDVVLLNSDTIVPPGWLKRLQSAARSAPDIGTVTPFSNNASILSVPGPPDSNPIPDREDTHRLDRLAWRANGAATVDIPVGVGFCLYIRRDCLDAVGLFRADMFAQGYGEENDFCFRARHLGWRHVALPGLFVAHDSGKSFGSAGRHLRRRNETILNRLHPGYGEAIAEFLAADTLFEARRRFDVQRWTADRRRGETAVILVTHKDGGGVEQRIVASAAAHAEAGRRAIVLRPARMPNGGAGVEIGLGPEGGFPNLRFALPDELSVSVRLLRQDRPVRIEAHHFLGHDPSIYQLLNKLRLPYDVHIHDYAWLCPRISLVGGNNRYCGEPDLAECEACISDNGRIMQEVIGVQALRDRSAGFLAGADAVIAPSSDAAVRLRRYFPTIQPVVTPHETDASIPPPPPARAREGRCVVCIVGGIGIHKGYNVLLACARDAARRDLPLDFIVVGTTIDDARLLATGRVFVTGHFKPHEAVDLIRRQNASLALLPSVWPETWCLGLSEIWRAGLRAAAFDFGAPAERIRQTGWGFLLPAGLPPKAMNTVLMNVVGISVGEKI